MGVVDDREQVVRNIAWLRRAERSSPAADDIARVRGDLEAAVGPTLPRATAARLLGMSQTALDRWIDRGDVPAVIARSGRREVPLGALLDLMEAVDEQRRSGDDRHPLAAVLRARRSAADRIDLRAILPEPGESLGHRPAELRGLAYHRAVAARLDERIVDEARERLRRWRDQGRIDPRYANEWAHILSLPLSRIAALISEDSPRAHALRQSSPLAGALHESERRHVLDALARAGR